MGYYLSFDGVDDQLKVDNGIAYNKVVMDVIITKPIDTTYRYLVDSLTRTSGGYIRYNGSWYNNMNASGLIFDTRTTITGTVATPYTGWISFFLNGSGFSVKAYDVKIYNGSTLVGHYDFTLGDTLGNGTVQDQSGNNNIGTLNGGPTWVSDGTAPTGTDVSYTYAMAQKIYADRTTQASLQQSIYADRSTVVPLAQNIYADRQYQFAIKQAIYANISEQFPTVQRIYADRSWDYPMLQQIYADYVLYSASFPMRQVISKDMAFSYPLKQAIWQSKSSSFPLKQKIYRNVSFQAPMRQIVYADIVQAFPLMQVVWTERSWDYAMMQVIFDPDSLIIGHILLRGDRVLYITLEGRRELHITLEGSRELNIRLGGGLVTAKNVNFSMVAGDTKFLDVTVDFDLTQAQEIKWVLYKSNQQLIYKSLTDHSITITKSGTENEFQIKLDPEDTIDLRGSYDHEAEVKDAMGNVSTVTEGAATFTRSLV